MATIVRTTRQAMLVREEHAALKLHRGVALLRIVLLVEAGVEGIDAAGGSGIDAPVDGDAGLGVEADVGEVALVVGERDQAIVGGSRRHAWRRPRPVGAWP